ncbi:hypothetical protein ACFV80_38295 [Streptomyces sp. NPDC059862]|uniref:hypothetical protein n=1 Tax=Streptomyces sp. NPDC059862 TaxID=3346975 RepID=UPI0036615A09
MHSRLDQRTVLLLLVGRGATYAAFEHPPFGTALMVGVGMVTLLHVLMKDHWRRTQHVNGRSCATISPRGQDLIGLKKQVNFRGKAARV